MDIHTHLISVHTFWTHTPVFMKVTFSSTLDYSVQNTRFQFKTPVFGNTQCHVHTFWQNTRFGVHTFSCTPVIVKHRLSIWYTRLNTHLISINTFLKTPDVTFTRFDKTHVSDTRFQIETHVFMITRFQLTRFWKHPLWSHTLFRKTHVFNSEHPFSEIPDIVLTRFP